MFNKKLKRAQTFMEYTLLIGVVVAIGSAMTPLLQRGVQAMVKGVADQIGNQINADEGQTRDSRTVYTNSSVDAAKETRLREWAGDITSEHDDIFRVRKDSQGILLFTDWVNEME